MRAKPSKNAGEVVLELNRGDDALMAAASAETKSSPFRLKKILVPTDFSDCAKEALKYAIPFAKEHHAAITLLHIVPTYYGVGEYGVIHSDLFEADLCVKTEKELSNLVMRDVPDEVSADTLVQAGSPANDIVEVAKSIGADLIVISTHGRTGLKHVLLGSVAEYVVRYAPCPVLVVREREHGFLATRSSAASQMEKDFRG